MIVLIVYFFLLCLVFALLYYATRYIPAEGPFQMVARVGIVILFILIIILWLLPELGPPPSLHELRRR